MQFELNVGIWGMKDELGPPPTPCWPGCTLPRDPNLSRPSDVICSYCSWLADQSRRLILTLRFLVLILCDSPRFLFFYRILWNHLKFIQIC